MLITSVSGAAMPGASEQSLLHEESQQARGKKETKTAQEAANTAKPAEPASQGSKPTGKNNEKAKEAPKREKGAGNTEALKEDKAKSTAAALKTLPVRTAVSPPESESFANSSSKKRVSVQKKLSFERGEAGKGKAHSPSASPASAAEDAHNGMQEQEHGEEEDLEEDEEVHGDEPAVPSPPKIQVPKTAAKSASKAKATPREAPQKPREKQETKGSKEGTQEVSKKAQRKASALCDTKPEQSPEKGHGDAQPG